MHSGNIKGNDLEANHMLIMVGFHVRNVETVSAAKRQRLDKEIYIDLYSCDTRPANVCEKGFV
jgi:hypothetical protein